MRGARALNLKERFEYFDVIEITQFVVLKHLLLKLSANQSPLKLIYRLGDPISGRQPGWDREVRRTWVEGLVLGANLFTLFSFFPFVNYFNSQILLSFIWDGVWGEKLIGWPFHVCKTIIIKHGKFTKP